MNRPLVVIAVMLSMFMAAMEATVVATAMPTVVADLHGIELYGYVGSLYIVACTIAVPLSGKLADRKGRRFVFLWGNVLFLLGSIASGAAPTMSLLVAARVVQGLGAGALQPLALIVIADIFSIQERGRLQGLFGAVWGLAGVSGPLLGGLIVSALSWRWVFYLNVPVGLLATVLFFGSYREPARHATPPPMDLAGATLLAAAIGLLLAASSGVVPTLTVPTCVLTTAGFVWVQTRAVDPVLPLSLFRSRVMSVSSVTGFLLGAVMMTVVMYVPLYVQAVLGASPARAGGSVAPMLIGWPIAAAVGGRLAFRIGPRALLRVGCTAVAAAACTLPFLVQRVELLRVSLFVFGLGMGASTIAIIYSVQEDADPRHRGVASASSVFFRSIGGAMAVGVFGAIFAHALVGKIKDDVISRVLQPHAGQVMLPSDDLARATLHDALSPLFRLEGIIGVLALITALAFPVVSFQKKPTAETPA